MDIPADYRRFSVLIDEGEKSSKSCKDAAQAACEVMDLPKTRTELQQVLFNFLMKGFGLGARQFAEWIKSQKAQTQ